MKDFPNGKEKQTLVEIEQVDGGVVVFSTVNTRHIPLSLSASGGWKVANSWLGFANLNSDEVQYPGPRHFASTNEKTTNNCKVIDSDGFTYIRDGGSNSAIMASVRKGMTLEVIGDEGNRHKINGVAYIHKSVVDCKANCQTSLLTNDSAPATLGNVRGPNARVAPGGDVLGVLNNKLRFSIVGKSGAYYKISIVGSVGKSACQLL